MSAAQPRRIALERLTPGQAPETLPTWSMQHLAGRLVEISGAGDTAALTLAFTLVEDAQRQGDAVAWVTDGESSFFPPDVAEGGVDLEALAVVRVPGARNIARAADRLLRSGAFGLVALDLASLPESQAPRSHLRRGPLLTMAVEARLRGLAEKHRAVLLVVSRKAGGHQDGGGGASSLASLRAQASRVHEDEGRYTCALDVVKDKRRTPGWTHEEVCRGPAGLR